MSKSKTVVRIALATALMAAATTAMAITESRCESQGGTPIYEETLVLADDCGFLADLFGFCKVGDTEREYVGCRL